MEEKRQAKHEEEEENPKAANKPSTATLTSTTGTVAHVERSGRFQPPPRGGRGRKEGRSFLDALSLSRAVPTWKSGYDSPNTSSSTSCSVSASFCGVLRSAWFDSGCQFMRQSRIFEEVFPFFYVKLRLARLLGRFSSRSCVVALPQEHRNFGLLYRAVLGSTVDTPSCVSPPRGLPDEYRVGLFWETPSRKCCVLNTVGSTPVSAPELNFTHCPRESARGNPDFLYEPPCSSQLHSVSSPDRKFDFSSRSAAWLWT